MVRIERLLGIAPDGGSGALETLVLIPLAGLIAAGACRRALARE